MCEVIFKRRQTTFPSFLKLEMYEEHPNWMYFKWRKKGTDNIKITRHGLFGNQDIDSNICQRAIYFFFRLLSLLVQKLN